MTQKDMIERIKNAIAKEEFELYGLRKDDREYKVGDVLPNSHELFQDPQYVDDDEEELRYPYIEEGIYAGYYDAGELDGTSTIWVREDNIEEMLEETKMYLGDHLYLVGGDDGSMGNDINEEIIKEAQVVEVLI